MVTTSKPEDATVNVGGTAALTVEASVAAGNLTYQWYSNSTDSNIGGTIIDGAIGSSYSAPTTTVGTNYYYCVITNTDNSVTGIKTATATSRVASVVVINDITAPSINTISFGTNNGNINVTPGTTGKIDLSSLITASGPVTVTSAALTLDTNIKGQNDTDIKDNVKAQLDFTTSGSSTLQSFGKRSGTLTETQSMLESMLVDITKMSLTTNQFKKISGTMLTLTDTKGNKSVYTIVVTANDITPLIYTVTFDSNGGSEVSPITNITSGAAITLPAEPTKTGYTFTGWNTAEDGSGTAFTTSTVVSANVTVYAQWTPTPTETTSTGTVVDDKTGAVVQGVETKVTTELDGTKTVAVKSQEAILLKQPDGTNSTLSDISKLAFSVPVTTGTSTNPNNTSVVSVSIASDGTINVKGLANNTESKFDVTFDLGNGQKIKIGSIDVKVSSSGYISLTSTLIDPYGILTDSDTGKPVAGANLTLYYANTVGNITNGKTPDTVVQLPVIDGFKPNNNGNPQVSDASGAYSFMVFPNTDYYVVATKGGYEKYTSPTISVEQEIVKLDIKMTQAPTETSSSGGGGGEYITSQNSTINPTIATFDKNTVNQADVSTTSTLNGNALTSITNGTKTLVDGTDYEVKDNIVTIKKNYLAKQEIGTITLTFNFSAGNTQDLAITVKDTTSSSENGAPGKEAVERISGQDRIDTALAIAKATYQGKVSQVILASSSNFPDALAGSVLAYKIKAPILLVGSSDEDQQKIIDYMKNNMDSIGSVYILGGTGVVTKDMEAKVAANGFKNITRLGGADRYETAVKIADELGVKEGTPVVIVSGENYPDAISISSTAAVNQYPILMVRKDEISDTVKKEISAIKPSKIYIVGLQGAVSAEVENQVAETAALDKTNVIRIGGTDRFETSLDVAKYFNLSGNSVCVASGNNFSDALVGSSYAAEHNAPIMLVGENLSDNEILYLKNKNLSGVTIFGGEGVVSKDILQQISQIIGK